MPPMRLSNPPTVARTERYRLLWVAIRRGCAPSNEPKRPVIPGQDLEHVFEMLLEGQPTQRLMQPYGGAQSPESTHQHWPYADRPSQLHKLRDKTARSPSAWGLGEKPRRLSDPRHPLAMVPTPERLALKNVKASSFSGRFRGRASIAVQSTFIIRQIPSGLQPELHWRDAGGRFVGNLACPEPPALVRGRTP